MSQAGLFQRTELEETCAEQQSPAQFFIVLSIIDETKAAVSSPH